MDRGLRDYQERALFWFQQCRSRQRCPASGGRLFRKDVDFDDEEYFENDIDEVFGVLWSWKWMVYSNSSWKPAKKRADPIMVACPGAWKL